MRMVIQEYLAAFRISKIKERYGKNYFGMFYFGIYMLVSMPTLVLGQNGGNNNVVEFYGLVCLLLFCVHSSQLHPIGLSKLMYLCPMSKLERRRYLLKSYLLKIGVIFLVSVVVLTLLGFVGKLNLVYIILFLCANMGLAISNSLLNAKRIKTCVDEKRLVMMSSGADGWETAAIIVSMCVSLFLLICLECQEDMQGILGIVMSVILLVFELPLVIKILKRVRPTMEQAMNYESWN